MDGAIARRLLAGGLVIGLLADAVDGPALGLNVPLLAATIVALGWSFRRRGRPSVVSSVMHRSTPVGREREPP